MLRGVLASLVLFGSILPPGVFAADSQAEQVRVGYFGLEALAPEENDAEVQRAQIDAEKSLKELVETGNAPFAAAQKSGASTESLNAMARDLQLKINASQQDIIGRAQSLSKRKYTSKAIGDASVLVARSHGLDILLNRNDVITGESNLVKHALNVTADMRLALEKKDASTLFN